MARIPSADDLGIRQPTAISQGGGTLRTRDNLALDLKSVETTAAQKGIKEWGETVANEELATAEVQFQIGAMAEAEKYKNDTDFDTVEERHAAGMADQLGKSAANITSRKTREQFMIRGELGVAKANATMNKKMTEKKNDREKAHSASAIDLLVKNAMDLEDGDPGEAALGIQLTLDSMVERDVITAVDAERMARTAQLDMAYGRLKSMDPQQQLEIINSTDPKVLEWLDDVPPDVVRQLKDQAEAAQLDNVAQAYAFETRGNENALNEMYDTAEEEAWDDERTQKTRLRILRLEQDDEVNKQQQLEDYYEEGAASIYFGETTLDMIEATPQGIDMLKKLSEGQRRNLVAAQDNATLRLNGEGRKYSDGIVVSKLKGMLAGGQDIEARKYWSENYASLNDGDFKYFDARTSPSKSKAPAFKPVQTTNQLMTDYLDANPLDEAGTVKLWGELTDQIESYQAANPGKNPDPAEIQQWVRDKHANIILEKPSSFLGYEFGGEATLERDMTPEQIQIVKPITNVYQAAGFKGTAAVNEFNAMTAPERAEFTRQRSLAPGMDPKEFLQRWKRGLNQVRDAAVSSDQAKKAAAAELSANVPEIRRYN
jgi:hypothetical protein